MPILVGLKEGCRKFTYRGPTLICQHLLRGAQDSFASVTLNDGSAEQLSSYPYIAILLVLTH